MGSELPAELPFRLEPHVTPNTLVNCQPRLEYDENSTLVVYDECSPDYMAPLPMLHVYYWPTYPACHPAEGCMGYIWYFAHQQPWVDTGLPSTRPDGPGYYNAVHSQLASGGDRSFRQLSLHSESLPVPEPSGLALVLAGVLALWLARLIDFGRSGGFRFWRRWRRPIPTFSIRSEDGKIRIQRLDREDGGEEDS